MNLAFLASNNGSGLRAIVAAIEAGDLAATPRLVVSNRKAAPALEFARAAWDCRARAFRRAPTRRQPTGVWRRRCGTPARTW